MASNTVLIFLLSIFQVLQEVQRELIHYGTTNISVMELSHRSADYAVINDGAQRVVRDLL
jgi:phosphoserine aminotransferase